MSWNTIVTASAVVVALAFALAFALRMGETDVAVATAPLFPGLQEQHADLSEIEIRRDDAVVLLRRVGDQWVMPEKHGYPARQERVEALLRNLQGADVFQRQKDAAALNAAAQNGAAAKPEAPVTIVLRDADGETLHAVEIGESHSVPGNATLDAQVVRRPPSAAPILATGLAKIETDPLAWLDRVVVDLAPERVAEVQTGAEGARLVIRRKEGGGFLLAEPAGRENELEGPWVLSNIAAGLQRLEFEDVRPRDAAPQSDAHPVVFLTDNGVRIVGELSMDGEAAWLTLDPAVAPGGAPPRPGDRNEDAERAQAPVPDPSTEVAEIARRTGGWAYRLPDYAIERLAADAGDVLP